MQVYKPIVDSLLSRVHNEVFSDQGVHRLMPIKDSLQEFEIIVKSSLTCLKQMLESNDDLIALLITEKMDAAEKTSGADARSKHQSVELLFEEYARQLNTLLQEINFLLKRVQSKQASVSTHLEPKTLFVYRSLIYLIILF
jgi:magnesium transporter